MNINNLVYLLLFSLEMSVTSRRYRLFGVADIHRLQMRRNASPLLIVIYGVKAMSNNNLRKIGFLIVSLILFLLFVASVDAGVQVISIAPNEDGTGFIITVQVDTSDLTPCVFFTEESGETPSVRETFWLEDSPRFFLFLNEHPIKYTLFCGHLYVQGVLSPNPTQVYTSVKVERVCSIDTTLEPCPRTAYVPIELREYEAYVFTRLVELSAYKVIGMGVIQSPGTQDYFVSVNTTTGDPVLCTIDDGKGTPTSKRLVSVTNVPQFSFYQLDQAYEATITCGSYSKVILMQTDPDQNIGSISLKAICLAANPNEPCMVSPVTPDFGEDPAQNSAVPFFNLTEGQVIYIAPLQN